VLSHLSVHSDLLFFQRSLSQKHILKIVDLRLKEVEDRLIERKMKLDVDEESKNYLASTGYSTTYGARPLNRTIQSELLNPLSIMILSDRVREGEVVRVRFNGELNRLEILPNHEGSTEDAMDIDDLVDDIEIEEMD
jgi:ATP-dependent Clp protease ATP-binding subunit ClpB